MQQAAADGQQQACICLIAMNGGACSYAGCMPYLHAVFYS